MAWELDSKVAWTYWNLIKARKKEAEMKMALVRCPVLRRGREWRLGGATSVCHHLASHCSRYCHCSGLTRWLQWPGLQKPAVSFYNTTGNSFTYSVQPHASKLFFRQSLIVETSCLAWLIDFDDPYFYKISWGLIFLSSMECLVVGRPLPLRVGCSL